MPGICKVSMSTYSSKWRRYFIVLSALLAQFNFFSKAKPQNFIHFIEIPKTSRDFISLTACDFPLEAGVH